MVADNKEISSRVFEENPAISLGAAATTTNPSIYPCPADVEASHGNNCRCSID